MQQKINQLIEKIKSYSGKPIRIISHFDTDGITSAAIFSRAMQNANIKFSMQITKGLDEEYISAIPEDSPLVFLDLASGSLNYLAKKKNDIIVIDHHEMPSPELPKNVFMLNPVLEKSEPVSTSALCYLVAKSLSNENIPLSSLAVLGMVGDNHDQNIGKIYDEIIKDSEAIVKKGLLIYPSTRPLNRALEYSSSPYIPNVTGSYQGVLEVLKDANIPKNNGTYKALYELTEEEMSNLTTAIILKSTGQINLSNLIGNIYLIKFQNKMEDAREISALVNACSRMDYPEIALGFCLGSKPFREKAEKVYREYKQHLISALKYVQEAEKITGKNYTIINAKNNIKDTIIGTTASIISHSPFFSEGTIIIALAYNENKIKVSARIAGKEGRNVREILAKAILPLGGEVGGHPRAAGCLIEKEKETEFIAELRKVLDIELVKVP